MSYNESKQMIASNEEPGAASSADELPLQRLAMEDDDGDDEPVVYRSAGGAGVLAMPAMTQRSAAWQENERVAMKAKSIDALAMPSWPSREAMKADAPTAAQSSMSLDDPLPEPALVAAPLHSQQPPLAPEYVEPSAFVVHSADGAAHVLDAVAAALAARGEVRCTVQARQWCCVCVLLPGCSASSSHSHSLFHETADDLVHFRVHLFQPQNAAVIELTSADDAVLVEFQRRSGSCVRFSTFVREMRSVLEQRLSPAPSTASTATTSPSMPSLTGPASCGLLPLEALWAELNTAESSPADPAVLPVTRAVSAPAASSSTLELSPALQQQQTATVRTLLAMTAPDASLASRTSAWASLASQLLPAADGVSSMPLCAATLTACGPALAGAISAVLDADADEPLCLRVQAARALLGLAQRVSSAAESALRELLLEAVAVATKSSMPIAAAAVSTSDEKAMELAERRLLERVYATAMADAAAALRS